MAKTFIVRDPKHPLFGIRVKNNNGTRTKYARTPKTDDSYVRPLAATSPNHKPKMNPIDRAIKSLSKAAGYSATIKDQLDKLIGA